MFRTARQDRVGGFFSSGKAALLGVFLLSSGAAAGFLAGRGSGKSHPAERAPIDRPSRPSEVKSSSELSAVLQAAMSSDLRQRLDSCLEHQAVGAEHVPSEDPQVEDPTAEEHLRSAQAEPREPLFAEAHTPALEHDLADVAQRFDFRFESLDCRSTRCTVKLDWPSLAAARAAFKSGFSSGFTRSRCQHRMVFPDVANEHARARTVLIATCESAHALAAGPGDSVDM
jgi:hypothetical protein